MIDRDYFEVSAQLDRDFFSLDKPDYGKLLVAFVSYEKGLPVLFDSNVEGRRRFSLMVAGEDKNLGNMLWEDEIGLVSSKNGAVVGFGFGPAVEIVGESVEVVPEYVTFSFDDFKLTVDPEKYDPLSEDYFSHCAGIRARQLVMELGLEGKLEGVEGVDCVRQAFECDDLVRYDLLSDPSKSVVLPKDFYDLMQGLFGFAGERGKFIQMLDQPEYREIKLGGATLLGELLCGDSDKNAVKDLLILQTGIEHAHMEHGMFLGFMRELEKKVREEYFPKMKFEYP